MKVYRSGNFVVLDNGESAAYYPNGFLIINTVSDLQQISLSASTDGQTLFMDLTPFAELEDANGNALGATFADTLTALSGIINFRTPTGGANGGGIVYVSALSDLPTPVGNVITLEAGKDYIFVGSVDLLGNRLVCGGIVGIEGVTSETSYLTSTGLPTNEWLITSQYSLPVKNISIQNVQKGIHINGQGTAALDWIAVNFLNVPQSVYVKDITNFISFSTAYLNSGGVQIDGTAGTVSLDTTLFSLPTGTSIEILSTATITRRFRVVFSSFVVTSGNTGIKINAGAVIPNDQFILFTCNFSGGGTYINGATNTDNISDWQNNKGIQNSASATQYYMLNNATSTPITVQGTFYKILGTTLNGTFVQRFTNTDNRATYTGVVTSIFKVSATISATAGNNQLILFRIAKNGTTIDASESQVTTSTAGRSENVKCQTVVELSTGQYIEIFCANGTAATAITASELNVTIEKLT